MKIYAAHGINDLIICGGYKGYLIKEFFANDYAPPRRRMKVGITGATGFVESHVVRLLQQDSAIRFVATARSAAAAARLPADVEVIRVDLAEPDDAAIIRLAAVDTLIHFSWDGLPNYPSLHHFEVELPRQYSFIKRLAAAGLPALLVSGTCYEYGMVDGALVEDRPAQSDNPYALTKATLQQQLALLQRQIPFALCWARLFYMYGAGQAPSAVYSQLIAAIARGDSSFPMSGGQQLRDFLPIEDVARTIVAPALQRADLGIVNVCPGQPVAVGALIDNWVRASGQTIRLDVGRYPYPTYKPFAFWSDPTKQNSLLAAGSRQ